MPPFLKVSRAAEKGGSDDDLIKLEGTPAGYRLNIA